ncbi:hypothetical protein [Xylella fastidiosa]|uniref:hypothetical protein n=1 Tax=Xylella fastidiosa TaxID=2371 RepID=UPI00021444A9|nr:hypothetical protein [Xylella fastidiosa]EGO82507.1 hypothetical protein XFEB_00583 [Xylella fastidiosa EB92.1]NMR12081.1 hypothetical protein [Xylella fastidiosa]
MQDDALARWATLRLMCCLATRSQWGFACVYRQAQECVLRVATPSAGVLAAGMVAANDSDGMNA